MIPIVSIVGAKSGAGKTTLIERLLPELGRRGWRVATVKHYAHGFDMDHEGKDTWRHRRAGACHVLLAGSGEMGLIATVDGEPDAIEAVSRFMPDCDLVLTEGYKAGPTPKIEIVRAAMGSEPACGAKQGLVAVATDIEGLDPGVPVFRLDDSGPLADFLEREFILPSKKRMDIDLVVDDRRVELKPFVANLLISAVRGLIAPLRGCEDPRSISLKIKLGD